MKALALFRGLDSFQVFTGYLSKAFQIINHLILKSRFFMANEIFPEWPVPEECVWYNNVQ